MQKNQVSKTSNQASNGNRYVESSAERNTAIDISEEIARKVYELSLVEEYEPLKYYEDTYEISRKYPHLIRKIKGKHEVSEWYKDGYICLNLNNRLKRSKPTKHDLIAIQWIDNDNPEFKKVVDHVNHIRDDNQIENLIWSTQASNCRNKSSHKGVDYDFVDIDDISNEAIGVLDYDNHQFAEEDYIYDPETDSFYYFNGQLYRKLYPNKNTKTEALYVYMRDINNNRVNVSYNKFKKIHGFI